MDKTIEVEVKIPVTDSAQVFDVLSNLGARETKSESQVDDYYDHPCRQFSSTDEALRLRTRLHGSVSDETLDPSYPRSELTYKGKKIDLHSKTRVELSSGIVDADSFKSILEELGFNYVASIAKKRTYFALDNFTISIDEVEELGSFVELELVVLSKDQIDSTRESIFEIVKRMGLNPEDSTLSSYLELLLEKRQS
ncbi:MAG: class IV adenylate cyclase [Candidatus Thorarchaeota archaeon]|jgi:adenylate cyclase class 2